MSSFRPTACRRNLEHRAELLRRLRGFFQARGFLEVETPVLSHDMVVDLHLDPFTIAPHGVVENANAPKGPTFLQTSPEFALKRLLAEGYEAIFQIARVFRVGERGPLHNPEFTMAEWYRGGDGMAEGIDLLDALAQTMLDTGPAQRLSYGEAFERFLGVDPHRSPPKRLRAELQRHGISIPDSISFEDADALLDLLLVERVQPNLGRGKPTILFDYPASQAALARIRPGDPPVAERFELYIDGMELANGYHELCDPDELRQRNRRVNQQRLQHGKPVLPESSRLLEAMEEGLPSSSGTALGFDRLAMLSLGAEHIDEVIAFPWEIA